MFLDYIEISNFRPYYGTQRINFGFNKDKNLTIILADNGSGKTSLVNALTWCLYGTELHDVRDRSEPLYNIKAAEEAEQEESDVAELDVQVKIRFYYIEEGEGFEDKKYFTITRKLLFQKWGSAEWESSFDDHLIVEESDSPFYEDDEAQPIIDSRIPEDMFRYFFFNGASLTNYFVEDSDLNLRTSVEEISQIDLINNVSDHLGKTFTNINNRYDNKKPKDKINYNKIIEEKITERNKKIEERNTNYGQIDLANENIVKFNDKLDKIDSEQIKRLNTKKKSLESKIKETNLNIKSQTAEYEKLIIELYPIAALFDELVYSLNLADEAKEKKTAPPQIERDLLNDILEDGVCICGTRLDEHPECIEELKNRLNNTSKMNKDTFYEDYYEFKSVLKKLKKLPKIELIKKDIEINKSNLASWKVELKSVSDEISSSDEEDVAFYETQINKNKKTMEDLRGKNTKLTSEIDSLNKEINKYKEQRDNESELEGELKELSDKISFCEEAMDIVSTLKINVNEHIREKINNNTKKQFTKINWANNKYVDVIVEEDYKIKIIKSSGHKVTPADISDGERSLLALSFMMALHSLSGFEIPLIIDAPLETLDTSKRIDFISDLHEFTQNKQIVFLFTDSQYTAEVRANMLKNVFDEYELKPYENKTEIVKHV